MTALLEATMLGAFSVSWYCSIWKMLATGRASGKSLGFVLLIVSGYVCGILSKVSLYFETGVLSALILLYSWNLLVTAFDAFLVWYYEHRTHGSAEHALPVRFERAPQQAGSLSVAPLLPADTPALNGEAHEVARSPAAPQGAIAMNGKPRPAAAAAAPASAPHTQYLT